MQLHCCILNLQLPDTQRSKHINQLPFIYNMEGQTSTYTYTQLDESRRQIRLLHLLPVTEQPGGPHEREDDFAQPNVGHGEDNPTQPNVKHTDNICCMFSLVSLDDDLSFEALSYVWGDTSDRIPVYLQDSSFLVTKSLYEALIHLRQPTERILWIDALCINQADPKERASQVAQMRHIYAMASTVVVYLGAWEGSNTAFDFIETLGTDPHQHYVSLTELRIDPKSNGILRSLLEFFNLPWWNRVWTVQEYVLAQKIAFQSGYCLLDGVIFEGFMQSIHLHNTCCSGYGIYEQVPSNDEFDVVLCIQQAWYLQVLTNKLEGRTEFFSLVTRFRTRQCSNPLDKVYGLLGLTGELFQSKIRLDYDSSPRVVYTSAVMAAVTISQTLNALSYTYGRRARSSDIPTYVPDFTSRFDAEQEEACLRRCLATILSFCAARDSLANILVSPSLEATTQAVFVGTISKTVDDLHRCCSRDDSEHDLADLRASCSRYDSPHQAYWQTICGGTMWSHRPEVLGSSHRLVQENDYAIFRKWRTWHNSSYLVPPDSDVRWFHRAFVLATTARLLAVTSTGYLGLVPEDAAEGDHVVLMPGGKVPYVLRRIEVSADENRVEHDRTDDKGYYSFIGDCYMHGIMHGEAYDETKLQTITLV